eukprot:850035-Pleurochrysis_carterae.AAC.6
MKDGFMGSAARAPSERPRVRRAAGTPLCQVCATNGPSWRAGEMRLVRKVRMKDASAADSGHRHVLVGA